MGCGSSKKVKDEIIPLSPQGAKKIDIKEELENISEKTTKTKYLTSSNMKTAESSPQKKEKAIIVKTRRQGEFNWSDQGSIEIITMNYKVVYKQEIKGFKVLKAKDDYLTSTLSWFRNEQEETFHFTIKDIASTNLSSRNSTPISTPRIRFKVHSDGRFLGIEDIDSLLGDLAKLQSPKSITKPKMNQLHKNLQKELEKIFINIEDLGLDGARMATNQWILEGLFCLE